MDDPLLVALAAWVHGDAAPLVGLLGFRARPAARAAVRPRRVGCSGSALAVLLPAGADALARARRYARRDPLRPYLFVTSTETPGSLELIALAADGAARRLQIPDVRACRASDLDALREMVPAHPGERGVALALRHFRALDRVRAGRRFFAAFRDARARVAAAWVGAPQQRRRERDRLALLFLCRLMFLYFLQHAGHLAGRPDYFRWLQRRYARSAPRASFYRSMLVPLFHGALNRRPERRSPRAQRLGRLPYLNGGLFDRDESERRHPGLDLPDAVVFAAFDDLLERYRFTSADDALDDPDGRDLAIDPEMLGRVFEGLMEAGERARTGTFYTPTTVVRDVVRHGLAALVSGRAGVSIETAAQWIARPSSAPHLQEHVRDLRVLDPACGSGAFLLGALAQLVRLRTACGAPADAATLVARALHGVDSQDDAALLCALRLWLSLLRHSAGEVPPLPNLDRRIRQGDALVDPLDLHGARNERGTALVQQPAFRARVRRLDAVSQAYLAAEPESRARLARAVTDAERTLAETWLAVQRAHLEERAAELKLVAGGRDLFGERASGANAAGRELAAVKRQVLELRRVARALRQRGALPFFSFIVHHAEAMQHGFDLVVSNPPWVRAHRWPAGTAALVRERYRVCTEAGWPYAEQSTRTGRGTAAQVDLAMLFVELSLRVLRPGGVLAMVLPAKMLRSLYASGARHLLFEQADVVRVEDHSLDGRAMFQADAFVAILIARKKVPGADAPPVQVVLQRRGGHRLTYRTAVARVPLVQDDHAAPWLLAPPDVAAVLRTMQGAGPPLAQATGLTGVHRGVMTGANDVMLLRDVEPKLAGLAHIRAFGARAEHDEFCALVEQDCIRPALRGGDVHAWQYRATTHLLWCYDEHLRLRRPPKYLARYLAHHASASNPARSGAPGRLFRVSPHLRDSMVVWRDLSRSLAAAPVLSGGRRPVPLNSVYFIGTSCDDDTLLLCAYLNALPLRVFARTIAERAKCGYFRFFAWVIAVLPLPRHWRSWQRSALLSIARAAVEGGAPTDAAQQRLDRIVADAYGLTARDVEMLTRFDAWLSGGPAGGARASA